MKPLYLTILLLAANLHCFAQANNTAVTGAKAYKNNIQAGVFAPAGLFVLQFEHALTKRISYNTIADCEYRYYSKDRPIDYSIGLMPQLRWYTQNKKGYNQGFYIAVSASAVYEQSYTFGSHNPQTSDIRLNSSYLNPGYIYENNIIRQEFSLYAGAGAGYQWLIKQRLIIDLGYNIQYAFFQQERFKNVPVQNEWQKPGHNAHDINTYMYFPFHINIGYAF
jgi:hypothetical protein